MPPEPHPCPLDGDEVDRFKIEVFQLNKKYSFLEGLDKSNFLEVNHFISKYSLGMGWWLPVLLILGDTLILASTPMNLLNIILKR